MSDPVQPLSPDRLFTPCDPASLAFETTAELTPLEDVVGQDRAVQAVRFAIGMPHGGYNLFALGPEGIGKYSLVRRFLEQNAADQPVPDDWCYVHNFAEPHRPSALRIPPGRGRALRDDVANLIDDLRGAIPAAFDSDEYRNRRGIIEEDFKDRNEQAFGALQKEAQEDDVAVIRTPVGLALAPVKDGEVVNPKDFEAMPEDERARRKQAMEELQKKLEELLRQVPRWEKEQRERMRELNREVSAYATGHLVDELKRRWEDLPAVLEYLSALYEDVVDNVTDFMPQEASPQEAAMMAAAGRPDRSASMRRYGVNVFVDNGPRLEQGREDGASGAPVVYEDHPIQPNLIGRVEHISQMGTLVTDHNLIRPGALHRANGGYIILDARKLLTAPLAWETLKRALRSSCLRIESVVEAMGWASPQTLEPEPIPLEVKVILLGEPQLYYLLSLYEPDFHELFKVAADFDDRMERTDDAVGRYARLIATFIRRHALRPHDRGAVARIIEHGSRLAADAERITVHMASIVDLIREADYWAGSDGAERVSADHVQRAIDAKTYRSDRLRERIQEEIRRGTLVIETEGARVGQINALSVMQMNDFAFGRPSRVSCRVRMGRGEVVDIEREVDLGGPLHTKGVLILSSYLGTRFAEDHPLSLSATLVFEQSYGGIDGDSASSTELYALLSALSGLPIRQDLAVTGSVDQFGRVQAIGGVNEKIEGFFDVCAARGLTGTQGVLIPATNVRHLMLRADVVEAAAIGRFHIYAVETIDQGIELLTGVPAGQPDAAGSYPIGSVNRAVANRLEAFTRKVRALAAGGDGRNGGRGPGSDNR